MTASPVAAASRAEPGGKRGGERIGKEITAGGAEELEHSARAVGREDGQAEGAFDEIDNQGTSRGAG
jgi:hypothetical protein